MSKTTRVVLICLFLLIAAARFCHVNLVWIEEAYGIAAASEILHGKFLYRDVWFDKPPLYALVYLIWDAESGTALRWYGFLYVALAAALLYRFALSVWGEREALLAAVFGGFFLTFGIPSAVIALAPDLLTVVPHTAAVYLAWKQKPFWSGFFAGIAFLTNAKGMFVLAATAIWVYRSPLPLLAGFAAPNLFFLAVLVANDALPAYWQQVWHWGWLYSRDTFVVNPLREGLLRTANWAGFHATLVIGTILALRERSRLIGWVVLSLIPIFGGWRFFPRYYFQLLPVFALLAARGVTMAPLIWRAAILALMLIPAVRFGPRYVTLAADVLQGRDTQWPDLAMMQDSRRAAAIIGARSKSTDTLLVWGYRPDVFVFTGLHAGTRFLDCQPLTGVMADRHLVQSGATASEIAAVNRQVLVRTRPAFIVDGVGLYNPELAITRYPDLGSWLANYREIGRTDGSIVYALAAGPASAALLQKR